MAFESNEVLDIPGHASTNVSALTYTGNPPVYSSGGIPQYYVVIPDTVDGTNEAVTLAANANVIPLGIAQDGPAVGPGQAVRIRALGVTKAIAGGAITFGQAVSANASGQVVAAAAAGATNTYIVGIALTPAAQAGDVISVLLTPGATVQVTS